MQLFVEAAVVGVLFMLIIVVLSYLLYGTKLTDGKLLTLGFLAGSIGHFMFEAVGANKWYCTNGNACSRS